MKNVAKIGLMLFTGFCIQNPVKSQTYSQRFYLGYYALSPMGGLLKGNNFYTIGYAEDTTCQAYYEPVLARFNIDGSLQQVNDYCIPDTGQQTYTGTNTILLLSNGNIVFHVLFGGGGKSLIYFCDSNANVLQYKSMVDTAVVALSVQDIIEHQSCLYVLCVEQYQVPANEIGISIIKLDLNGNFIWRKSFNEVNVTEFPSIIRGLSDGRIMIGACKSNFYQGGALGNELRHTYIFTIDTAGTQLEFWVDPNPNTFQPTEFIYTADNHLIYTGGYKKGQWLGDIYTTGYICKMNWLTKVKNWEIFKGDSSIVTSYNDIDLFGNTLVASGSFALIDSMTGYGGITKIDLNGNILWHRLYRGLYLSIGNDNYFYESAVLADGSIMACGQSNDIGGFSGHPVRYQGWIARVDSNGLGITNLSLSLPDEPSINNEVFEILLTPNPSTNTIYLTLKDNLFSKENKIEITNISGQVVLKQYVPLIDKNPQAIDISGFVNGTYIISIRNDKGFVKRKVFIKN